MSKNIIILISVVTLLITKVNLLCSSEFIQDIFKINDVFLLPSLNTSSPDYIKFNYFNENLYVINNDFKFSTDSINFTLYKSETNKEFKEYNLTIPSEGFSKRLHICDIYVLNNKIYLLEFRNLIEFEFLEEKLIFKNNYRLNNSCSEILSINSEEVRMTLNYITSDVYKDKEINFIYRIDFKNNKHSRINFDNTNYYKLINVGPRINKVFIDDSTLIFSDIINFRFNIETNEGLKQISYNKENWISDKETLNKIKVNYKHQKNSFIDLVNYNDENASIFNLFKIDNSIIVKYVINFKGKKEIYYDILRYNKADNSLSILHQNLRDHDLAKLNNFGVEKLKLGLFMKSKDQYLLNLVKFPFANGTIFKTEANYLKKTEEIVINDGVRYSVIVRELK